MLQVEPMENREKYFYASNGLYAEAAKRHNKLLQTYDKNLLAKWLPEEERWSIWTKDRRGNAYMCYVCVDPETKGYRSIAEIDKTFLGKIDKYRKDKAYSLLKEVDENNDKITKANKKKLREAVIAASKDRWRQFTGNKMIPCGISF